jgi:hypothetical protein
VRRQAAQTNTLHEAVAQRLMVFRDADWVSDPAHGQATITVVVKQPEVQHKMRVKDFENWLESAGRNPAEMSLKSRLRQLLAISAVAEVRTHER